MKYSLSLIAALFIIPTLAFAGTQTSTLLNQPTYTIENNKLKVVGTANGEVVSYSLTSVIVRGQIGKTNCSVKSLPCTGRLRLIGETMTLNVGVDENQDGNYETVIKGIEVGSVSQDTVDFSAPTQGFFVQDRYSFLEKMSGLKDKDYIVLEVTLSLSE